MYNPTTLIAGLVVSSAALANAAPVLTELQSRAGGAVTVFCDTGSASVTPTQVDVIQGTDGQTAAELGAAIEAIIEEVQAEAGDDITKRKSFTQDTVASVVSSNAGKNVVTSNVGYTLSCTPSIKYSTKYDAAVGAAVSFDVLVFGSGCTFTLNGDGGFQNWAYSVQSSCKVSGKTLTC